MVGRALTAAGGAALAVSVGLWGHLYRVMTGPELGFTLRDAAPCLVSAAGLCAYPLCGDPLFAVSRHASTVFWTGVGLVGAGLIAWSRRPGGAGAPPPDGAAIPPDGAAIADAPASAKLHPDAQGTVVPGAPKR